MSENIYFTYSLLEWIQERQFDRGIVAAVKRNARLLRILAGLSQKQLSILMKFKDCRGEKVRDIEKGRKEYTDEEASLLYDIILHQPMKSTDQLKALLEVMSSCVWSESLIPEVEERVIFPLTNSSPIVIHRYSRVQNRRYAVDCVRDYLKLGGCHHATAKLLEEEIERMEQECKDVISGGI